MAHTAPLYILAGRCIDGSGGEVQKNVALRIEGGTIVDIADSAMLSTADKTAAYDLSHCTLLPPLVDCSVRLSVSGATGGVSQANTNRPSEGTARQRARSKHFCLSHGVLGVADCDDQYTSHAGRSEHRSDDLAVKASGRLLRTDRHKRLDDAAKAGDFVKIVHLSENMPKNGSSACEEAGQPSSEQERANLGRLVGQAHAEGLKTVVVANGHSRVREALHAGCDAVEEGLHMIEEGEDILAEMVRRDILWIPVLIKIRTAWEASPAAQKSDLARLLVLQQRLVRRARELGVRTAVGTAAGEPGILHGEAVVEEIKLFMKSGYSRIEALRCGSGVGAAFFDMQNIGMLKKGRPANFLVSRGTAQQLPRKLAYLEDIFYDGLSSAFYRKNPVKTVAPRTSS